MELVDVDKSKNEKLFLFFIYILYSSLLIFLQGFRGEVGNDYLAYRKYYESKDVLISNFELGFKYLVLFFKSLHIHYDIFQLIIAVLTGSIFYPFIYKKSRYPLFIIFIYFCVFYYPLNFSQLRQQIAICILMLFCMRKKKNTLFSFLGLMFASLFHRSCLILVVIPILEIIIKKKKKCVLCLLFFISLSMIFCSKPLFDFIIAVGARLSFLPTVLLNYYTQTINEVEAGIGVYASYILCALIILFSDKEYKKTFYYVIGFIIDKSGFFVVVFQRFAYYFYLNKMGLDAYSNIVSNKRFRKFTRVGIVFFVLTYFLLINLHYLKNDGSYIVPYTFF